MMELLNKLNEADFKDTFKPISDDEKNVRMEQLPDSIRVIVAKIIDGIDDKYIIDGKYIHSDTLTHGMIDASGDIFSAIRIFVNAELVKRGITVDDEMAG